MTDTRKVRVNLANEQELLELPGLSAAGAAAIVRFRSEHGPIKDAAQLGSILRGYPHVEALKEHIDFAPGGHHRAGSPGGVVLHVGLVVHDESASHGTGMLPWLPVKARIDRAAIERTYAVDFTP